jgi:RNA polymerase sigma factor (sigma-70 family)
MTVVSSSTIDLRTIDSVSLVSMCAQKPEDSELWAEFLRRFSPKLKLFIAMMLKTYSGTKNSFSASFDFIQGSSDLLQNTVLRLVQNDCAALKRFSGTTESELLAYLAVIARSSVRSLVRNKCAQRRFLWFAPKTLSEGQGAESGDPGCEPAAENPIERKILASEVQRLLLQTIRDESNSPDRDALIFQLYFDDGLSFGQIAACEGIGLSRTGVEKVLTRLKEAVRSRAGVNSVEARS